MPHLTAPWAGPESERRMLVPSETTNGSINKSNPNTPRDESKADCIRNNSETAKPVAEERDIVRCLGQDSSPPSQPVHTPARTPSASTSPTQMGAIPHHHHPTTSHEEETLASTEKALRAVVTPQSEGSGRKEMMRNRSPHPSPYYSSPPHSTSKANHHYHHHYLQSYRSPPHPHATMDHHHLPYHYSSPSPSYRTHHHHHRHQSAPDYSAPHHHAHYPPPLSYDTYYTKMSPPRDHSMSSSMGGTPSHPHSRLHPNNTPTPTPPDHTNSVQSATVKSEIKNGGESNNLEADQSHKENEESPNHSKERKEDDVNSSKNTEISKHPIEKEEQQEKAEVCMKIQDKKRVLTHEGENNEVLHNEDEKEEKDGNNNSMTSPPKAKRSKPFSSPPTTALYVTPDAKIPREKLPYPTHSRHNQLSHPSSSFYSHHYASSSYNKHRHYRVSSNRPHYDSMKYSYHNHHHNNRSHHHYASARRSDVVPSPYSHGMDCSKYYHYTHSRSTPSQPSLSMNTSSSNPSLSYSHYKPSHRHYRKHSQVPDVPKTSLPNLKNYNNQSNDKSSIHSATVDIDETTKSNDNKNATVHSTPSRQRCKELTPPIPSKFWGNIEKFKDIVLPEFHHLVNFPSYVSKNKALNNSNHNKNSKKLLPASPNAVTRRCVMCGKDRLCTASTISNNPSIAPINAKTLAKETSSRSTVHIIPRQNKGLCTACDVTVWVYIPPKHEDEFQLSRNPKLMSNIEIKWCKGCKNFRTWAAFGDKGGATKCVKCRERQREKYATLKKVTMKKEFANNQDDEKAKFIETIPEVSIKIKTGNIPGKTKSNVGATNTSTVSTIKGKLSEPPKNDRYKHGNNNRTVDGSTLVDYTNAVVKVRLEEKQITPNIPQESSHMSILDKSNGCNNKLTINVNNTSISPTTVKSNLGKEVTGSGLDKLIAAVHAQEV